MRGLKRGPPTPSQKGIVAPLVGAWIETLTSTNLVKHLLVAPLVGAWIETPKYDKTDLPYFVAPLVGAWIETS